MSVAKNVETIRAFYEKELPTRIPFDTHPLKEADDYAKELYSTMLAVILQYENEPMREQTIFLERIITGIGLEASVQTVMQKAQMFDEKFAKDFYEEFVGNKLAQNFVVDGLVMTNCCQKPNQKQLGFLSEVVDVLGIEEELFKELVMLSQAVLCMSSEKYMQIIRSNASVRFLDTFNYYFSTFIKTYKLTNQVFDQMIENDEIVFIFRMKFTSQNMKKVIEKKKLIIFKECEFANITMPMELANIQGVIVDNCLFKDSSSNIFNLAYVENICIRNSTVKNIEVRGSDYIYGGVIRSIGNTNLFIYESKFEGISLYASHSNPYSSAPLFIGEVKTFDIRNNKFFECNANGTYQGNGGGQIVNDANNHIERYEYYYIEQNFTDDRTFLEYLETEYGIKPEQGEYGNEIENCNPNHLIFNL